MKNLQLLANRYAKRYGLPPINILPRRKWQSSFCRPTTAGFDIHIRADADTMLDLRHEVGHAILDTHLGTGALRRRDFCKFFGDPDRTYGAGVWYFLPWSIVEPFYTPDPGLPSVYAQTHPVEAFAETIVVALSRRQRFASAMLRRRVSYCRRVLRDIGRACR